MEVLVRHVAVFLMGFALALFIFRMGYSACDCRPSPIAAVPGGNHHRGDAEDMRERAAQAVKRMFEVVSACGDEPDPEAFIANIRALPVGRA